MDVLDEQLLDVHDYGHKAFGLLRLISKGFAVPGVFVIAPADPLDHDVWAAVNKWTNGAIDGSGKPFLAVRSSSQAEDGVTESGAGRFTSLLDIFDADDLIRAVQRVRESGDPPLAVIVQ